jgi:hypothetical protein
MQVFRTKTFRKHVRKLGVTEEEVKALEEEIAADPATGDVIPGLKGARKIRFATGGKGKRGGGRAIYIVITKDDTAYLLVAYAKARKEDLTQDDKDALLKFIALL